MCRTPRIEKRHHELSTSWRLFPVLTKRFELILPLILAAFKAEAGVLTAGLTRLEVVGQPGFLNAPDHGYSDKAHDADERRTVGENQILTN